MCSSSRAAILHTPLIDFYDAPSLKFFSRIKTVYAKDIWKWVRNHRFRKGISKQLDFIAQDLSFDSCNQVIRVHPTVLDEIPGLLSFSSGNIVGEATATHTPEFTAIFVCKWVYEAPFYVSYIRLNVIPLRISQWNG